MPSTLKSLNYIRQVLTAGYTAGAGTLTIPDGAALGTLSASDAVILTTFLASAPTVPVANYRIQARAGNVLTIAALTWGVDTSLAVGDIVTLAACAELFDDLRAPV